MKQKPLLLEAHDTITSLRAKDYGDPKETFARIAAQWSLYLNQKHDCDVALSAQDVCWLMADLKKARQMTKYKRDNVVDAAGYIGLIEQVL